MGMNGEDSMYIYMYINESCKTIQLVVSNLGDLPDHHFRHRELMEKPPNEAQS